MAWRRKKMAVTNHCQFRVATDVRHQSSLGASFDQNSAPESNNVSSMSCAHALHANAQVARGANVTTCETKLGRRSGITHSLTLGVVAMSSHSMPSHSQIAPAAGGFASAPAAPPLLRRFYDSIVAHRRARAEQEIARYLQTHRDKLTDSLEREIERRLQNG
jgi:hypothetical protein